MIKKLLKLDKNTLISSIMTLITVLVWIGFDVYRVLTKTTITKATQEQMRALDPRINREIIEELKSNLSFSEEELNKASIIIVEEPVGEPESTEEIESSSEATEAAIPE